jgi:hypothetical protein
VVFLVIYFGFVTSITKNVTVYPNLDHVDHQGEIGDQMEQQLISLIAIQIRRFLLLADGEL